MNQSTNGSRESVVGKAMRLRQGVERLLAMAGADDIIQDMRSERQDLRRRSDSIAGEIHGADTSAATPEDDRMMIAGDVRFEVPSRGQQQPPKQGNGLVKALASTALGGCLVAAGMGVNSYLNREKPQPVVEKTAQQPATDKDTIGTFQLDR